jgi:hypothetical protein
MSIKCDFIDTFLRYVDAIDILTDMSKYQDFFDMSFDPNWPCNELCRASMLSDRRFTEADAGMR